MNNKTLIQSGIIELYVLGLCTEAQAFQVEEALKEDKLVQKEFDEINKALENIALEQALSAPAFLKNKLLEKIEAFENKSPLPVENKQEIESPVKPVPKAKKKIIVAEPSPRNFGSIWQWLLAATIILLIASISINSIVYPRMTSAEEEAAVLRNNIMLLYDENGTLQADFDLMLQNYSFLKKKNLKAINLHGTEAHPDQEALIFWNKDRGELILVTNGLAVLEEGEHYQLWALDNNVFKNAGLVPENFKVGGAYPLFNVSSAQAFLITLEKSGRIDTPTLENSIVFGRITG